MNAQSYVQTPCPFCGASAWGHPTMPVACATCGRQIPAMASAAPPGPFGGVPQGYVPPAAQPQAYSAPQPYGGPAPQGTTPPPVTSTPTPSSNKSTVARIRVGPFNIPIKMGGSMGFKVIAGVVIVVVLAVVGVVVKGKLGKTKKGNLSYSSLGIDAKKADPDKMIEAVGSAARKWHSDAIWYSINLQKVKADGTVDVTQGGAEVVYISKSRVKAASATGRKDSIKKFAFGPAGVSHDKKWDATNNWGDVPEANIGCAIKDVVKLLGDQGLTGSKTVRITFDPQFAKYWAWHVIGSDPKIDAYYSMEDCSLVNPK